MSGRSAVRAAVAAAVALAYVTGVIFAIGSGDGGIPRANTPFSTPPRSPITTQPAVPGSSLPSTLPTPASPYVPPATFGPPSAPVPAPSAPPIAYDGRPPRPTTIDVAPIDYTGLRARLTKPAFAHAATDALDVTAHDGVGLYVEVTRPDPDHHGEGPWPVILEASPYHGTLYDRTGTRIMPDPRGPNGERLGLTGYFVPRGYAVVMMDLRGTGRSGGCLDHWGPDDALDLKTIVEWAASQPWSSGRVAIAGHSYPGSTPTIAAAMRPKGLVTIVPSAGLASMYDHQFNYGVPYNLQWMGPVYAYEQLALQRHAPGGDDFGEDAESTGCGIPNSALFAGYGQLNGQYQDFHAIRDYRAAAIGVEIPIFIVHGVNDNAARIPAAEWFFGNRFARPGDKVWIGQWDHGTDAFHPNQRYAQWQYALHAWFDRHLKGLDVDTGPAVEAFLQDGTVYAGDAWRAPTQWMRLAPVADGSLAVDTPAPQGAASYGETIISPSAAGQRPEIVFRSEPLAQDAMFLGLPELQLSMTMTTSQVVHVITTVHAENDTGALRPITTCAIQPQLREGVDRTAPIVPGELMTLRPQCFTAAHRVRAGERLVLTIGDGSPHHVVFPTMDPQITVTLGSGSTEIAMPIVPGAEIHRDVEIEQPGG